MAGVANPALMKNDDLAALAYQHGIDVSGMKRPDVIKAVADAQRLLAQGQVTTPASALPAPPTHAPGEPIPPVTLAPERSRGPAELEPRPTNVVRLPDFEESGEGEPVTERMLKVAGYEVPEQLIRPIGPLFEHPAQAKFLYNPRTKVYFLPTPLLRVRQDLISVMGNPPIGAMMWNGKKWTGPPQPAAAQPAAAQPAVQEPTNAGQ